MTEISHIERKPCRKCPEGVPLAMTRMIKGDESNELVQVHYVLNDGNELEFYSILGQSIPDVPLKYGRPSFYEDGSMEFPVEPAEELYGYERDENNRRLFHSQWPSCVRRVMGTFVREGMISVACRCNHYLSDKFTKPVLVSNCLDCPVRIACRRYEPLPKTAEACIIQAETRARDRMKAALGNDIFERAEENLKAWREGRCPVHEVPKTTITGKPTGKIENSASHDGQPAS